MSVMNSIKTALRLLNWKWQEWKVGHTKGVLLANRVIVCGRPDIYLEGGKIKIGDNVTLRSVARGYQGAMYGPVRLFATRPGAEIIIGQGSRLNGCCIAAWKRVIIGKYCLIAANTSIMDADGHSIADEDCFNRHCTKDEPEDVVIDDYVWIGMNCIITKGVHIGKASIVAAGSIVTRDVPEFSVVGGSPATLIRKISCQNQPKTGSGCQ
jgi:acetyltransferase-like isoleucine patch superfamily enzyme